MLVDLWLRDAELGAVATGFAWISDGVDNEEAAIFYMLRALVLADLDMGKRVVSNSWLADSVNAYERDALDALNRILSKDLELAITASKMPWLADGLTAHEPETLHALDRVAYRDLELARLVADSSSFSEGLKGDLSSYVLSSLARLAGEAEDVFSQVTGQPWFADGLNGEEAALVVVLGSEATDGEPIFDDLLRVHYAQSKTVSLPLAGDVNIWAIQNTPFQPNEDLTTIIADAARILEDFLGAPFPTTDIILLFKDLRSEDQDVDFVVRLGGYAGQNYGSHVTVFRENWHSASDLRSLVTHEVTHYYDFEPGWFNEGVAEFVAAYVNDRVGVQSLPVRMGEVSERVQSICFSSDEELENIRHSIYWDSQFAWRTIGQCTYDMGENFILHAFQVMGEEAMSAALRELHMQLGEARQNATEERVYDTLLKHTPPGQQEEFRDLYRRLHGGPYADPDIDFSDDHGDEVSYATTVGVGEVIEGTLNYMFDFDYFRIRGKPGQKYLLDVDHGELRASSVMLYFADGSRAPWKSRGRVSSGPQIQWVAPSTEPYYFAVHIFGGKTGEYTFKITPVADILDDHGDSAAGATDVAVGEIVNGVVEDEFDLDYFLFEVVKGQGYWVSIRSGTLEERCCVADLYDPEFGYVGEGSSGTAWWAWRSGEQYLVVHGGPGNTGTYTLEIGKLD